MTSALQRVQSTLMEALLDEGATISFLEAAAEAGDAPVAQLMIANHRRKLVRSAMSGPVDRDVLSKEADYQDINPRVHALSKMRVGRTMRDRNFIAYDDMLRDRTYQELIIAAGLGHTAGVPLELSSERVTLIALHRPIHEDAFSDDAALRLEAIGKACAPIFHFMDLIHRNDASTALDAIKRHIPAAIITRTLGIVEHNEAFDEVFFQGTNACSTRQLRDLLCEPTINSAVSALSPRSNIIGGRFPAGDRHGLRRFIGTVSPIPWIGSFPPGPGIAILTLERLCNGKTLDQALAADVFGLTPAEADIASRLVVGDSLVAIARDRGVAVSTVRVMLRSMFFKTDTHRQAELVTRLSHLAS